MDLSRNCSAPLTWYFATREKHRGIETNPEFHAEAVHVALASGLPCKQAEDDFGIGFSTLCRRILQDQRNPEKPAVQSDLEREVSELRKENRMFREERDVLKKGSH